MNRLTRSENSAGTGGEEDWDVQPTGATMKAVVLDGPGPPSALHIRQVPRPYPRRGWVLISVRAFGLNQSELHMRLGLAGGVTFPRVPGSEAVGVVARCPGGEFSEGQQVATFGEGMGRVFDGGYAEYCCVPVAQVVPFRSDLDWTTLGAIPVMLATASGSLTIGLDAKEGQSLLIRGGTSSVGMATAVLAKRLGMRVLSTTRQEGKALALTDIGVDEVILDDGQVAGRVQTMVPGGVDAALELIGAPTLPDTLRSTRVHGVVCFTGMLSNQWTIDKFYPIEYIPRGVRLTSYSGGAADLPPAVLQGFIDAVAEDAAVVPIGAVHHIDQIVEAHTAMEEGRVAGKIVVLT
jgi:NADPH:quinone reductase